MLEGELDGDRLLTTSDVSGGIEQKLDLTDGAKQEILGVGKVESLVAFDNTWVLAGKTGYRAVEETENILLEGDSIIVGAHEIRTVGITSGGVNKGKEGRRLSVRNAIGGTIS